MKITFLILVISVLQATAGVFSQNQKVTLDVKNARFEKILTDIEKQTGYTFLYSITDVGSISQRDIKVKEKSLFLILDDCLKGTNLKYNVVDKTVVIIPKKKSANSGEQKKQDKNKVKGKVVDKKGNPLPGVTVIVKGTGIGVATDKDGKFIIVANKGDVLIFSFIGMKSQNIAIKDNKPITVELLSDNKVLDEVVATGYANVSKESFTGNSITVKKEELLKVSKHSIISALQVFDPSFRIEENNELGSNPNAVPEMYIRGRSGIGTKELDEVNFSRTAMKSNPNLPTFILDGFEVSIEKIFDFDINRIEKITILKDAAATAMYGSRAANGVVVITTVAPKSGELHVTYNLTGSVEFADLSDYNLMNAAEKIETERLAGLFTPENNQGEEALGLLRYQDRMNELSRGVNTDWLYQPLRNAINHKHSIYIEGGGNDLTFGLDLQYDNHNGAMKESYRNRYNVGFFINYKINNFQVRNYVSFSTTDSKDSPYGNFSEYTKQLPYNLVKDKYGKYSEYSKIWFSGTPVENPLYRASLNNISESSYTELRDNLSINWYINDYFQIKASLSASIKNNDSKRFIDPRSVSEKNAHRSDVSLRGQLNLTDGKSVNYSSNLFAYYNRTINIHNINFYTGFEINNYESESLSQHYRGFPSGFLNSQNYAKEIVNLPRKIDNTTKSIGAILGLNYTIKETYLFDLSVRIDGSSEFGANKRYATFWATGFGINFHKYDFIKNIEAIDMLRLRSSYGQTGKVNFPAYCAINMYQTMDGDQYKNGYGAQLMALGNKDLVWEKTNTIDVGVETTLLKNLLTAKVSYYNAKTEDLITDVTVPSSAGFTSYKDNLGEIENKGYEFSLTINPIKTKDLFVSLFVNGSHNENKILKISDALKAYNDKVDTHFNDHYQGWHKEEMAKPVRKYVEGGSTTSIFGMESLGIDPITGEEVFLNRDGSISYDWTPENQNILGNTSPDLKGSFGFNFQYKNISVFTSFMYEYGGQRYNTTLVNKVENVSIMHSNVDKRVLSDRWIKVGDFSKYKDITSLATTLPSSRFVQDNNYINFSSITLNYDFNKKFANKLGFRILRLGISSNDIFRISSIKQERGTSYPYCRTINFSLKAQF